MVVFFCFKLLRVTLFSYLHYVPVKLLKKLVLPIIIHACYACTVYLTDYRVTLDCTCSANNLHLFFYRNLVL